MKIDLFGGTGFIGNNFYKKYLDATYLHERENNVPKHENILYMISTINNYNIFTDPFLDINTNLIKLISVLENCKNKDNLIFNYISSWYVYGKVDNFPVNENSNCNPVGFYSITKRCAEQLIINYCSTFNIKYRILRLCNIYGLGDNGVSKKKNALQYIIDELKKDNPIFLYNNGYFTRDYLHVDDACDAIFLCLNKAPLNEIINISSGKSEIFREMIDYVRKKINSKSEIHLMEKSNFDKLIEIENMYIDNTKLKNLGFQQKINIFEGIDSLL